MNEKDMKEAGRAVCILAEIFDSNYSDVTECLIGLLWDEEDAYNVARCAKRWD